MAASTSVRKSPTSALVPRRWVEAVFVGLLGRRLLAFAWLTLKAAVRYRLIQILVLLLLAAVVGLPSIVKHDGTAQGFTQILLTYTLGSMTVLLGFATLWLGCGSLARDVEECQIQMVVTKPVARWEVWLGKWLGITVLNALLLAAAGLVVFVLLEWRASRLPAEVQTELRNKILVARGSVKEPVDYTLIERESENLIRQRLKQDANLAELDRGFVRTQIVEQVKAQYQVVPPGTLRRWTLNFGGRGAALQQETLHARVKFFSAVQSYAPETFAAIWQVGPPNGRRLQMGPMSLAAESFHEFKIPPGLLDENGVLTMDFLNLNDTALLFPLEEGLEVLYPEGGFGLNFVRGLGVILCWLALLAAIGLATASFLSFPVAAFCSIAILVIGFSTGTLRQVIEEGGISPVNRDTGLVDVPRAIDRVAVPIFKGLLWTINLVRDFSPVDSLSSGRSITWGQLGRAVAQILLLMGGLFAAIGIWTFHRRELATAQGP